MIGAGNTFWIPEEAAKMTTGHPHADLMMQYAEVAKTNPEPWTEFEVSVQGDDWSDCTTHPLWNDLHGYRRKPKQPKKIKFEAWVTRYGALRFEETRRQVESDWTRLPALDLECEVSE